MTLCRWFQVLDPDEIKSRLTPRTYQKWLRYYERNACHPLSLPMTIGINSLVQSSVWGGSKGKKLQPDDFVFPSIKKKIDADDPDALLAAMSGGL